MLNLKVLLLFFLLSSTIVTADMPAIQFLWRFFTGTNINSMSIEELGQSRGQCRYDFINYVGYSEDHTCNLDDNYIEHLLVLQSREGPRKPPIMVRCLQPEHSANSTSTPNELLMMKSVVEIMSLLKPIGNATKRYEVGSCVVVLFYSISSLGCAHVAPYANMLPHLFPTLRIAAIDAFEFPSFNTEFGIVGLPTLLLFHQGRPIVKFYSDVSTFAGFITRHTGIKQVKPSIPLSEIKSALPLQPVEQADYILVLAWAFILLCLGSYFAKSSVCKQIIEMIKRNWRESEAQLETN